MKKDIDFSPVKDVHVVIALEDNSWRVYLINRSGKKLENILITSKGYGETKSEIQKTSVLRHMIPSLEQGDYALIEPIDPSVFHLSNEYWVSYYVNGQVFDKKFIFLPDSIIKEHLVFIDELELKGILHD